MVNPEDFDITGREPPEGVLADLLLLIVTAVGSVLTIPPAAAAGQAELVRQRSLRDNLPTLNTPQEAAEGVHRGVISQETFLAIMERHGFTGDAASLVKQISRPLLNIGELITLWLRGELSDAELQAELGKHGFTPDRISELKTLAFAIPGIQDLVLFAVREVFDVQQAEAFGQFEGVSGEARSAFDGAFAGFGSGPAGTTAVFEAFAKKSGLAPEWATAYWAAHWQLPSPNQMFEMFHRRIIDRDTLEVGIRALDFTGFWREKLLGISFRPLTRVDIRRFHALGLMTEDEVQSRYQDVGFSPDDAALMTEFTVAFNAPEDTDTDELRDLTRSQVLSFLRSGLFNEETAREQLTAIGFSPENTATIIALEQLKIGQEAVDNEIAVIKARLKNGVITENDAIAALDLLDMPTQQRTLVLAQIDREKASELRLPSRGELDTFVRERILSIEDYVDEIRRLGFSDPWPERFAELVIQGFEDDEEKRLLSRSLIIKLLVAGLIERDDAFVRLVALRFSEGDADLLIREGLGVPDDEGEPVGKTLSQSAILRLFREGLISQSDAGNRLVALGLSTADTNLLLRSEAAKR